jgi:2-keto-4-pentenoate hydratase/2-oxohepta-3-ene-1,7-dioic acid hydratase in catechol pathway
MHLARMQHEGPDGPEVRILASAGLGQAWVDVRSAERLRLERAGAGGAAALRIATAVVPSSMSAALAGGEAFLDAAGQAIADPSGDAHVGGDPRLINALDPSGYRDYTSFEGHFSFGYRLWHRPVPEVMYELPVSYFGNPLSFVGPDEDVVWPQYSQRMDYELELGIVIGRYGSNLAPDEAIGHVLGLTILNDWSARDIQVREMAGSLGPSKGKHFACGAGPYIATLDSVPWECGLRMQARVNGETWCDADSAEMIWTIGELVAWASQGEMVVPGMLLGTGTCNGGSTLELDRELSEGDVIELEIEGLGVLKNRLVRSTAPTWDPDPRTPGAWVTPGST